MKGDRTGIRLNEQEPSYIFDKESMGSTTKSHTEAAVLSCSSPPTSAADCALAVAPAGRAPNWKVALESVAPPRSRVG